MPTKIQSAGNILLMCSMSEIQYVLSDIRRLICLALISRIHRSKSLSWSDEVLSTICNSCRPVSGMSWSPSGDQLAVSYCSPDYLAADMLPSEGYIFQVEQPLGWSALLRYLQPLGWSARLRYSQSASPVRLKSV